MFCRCLQSVIEGCGKAFNEHITQNLLDLIFQALNHPNRFVRETGYQLCGSLVRLGRPEGTNNPFFFSFCSVFTSSYSCSQNQFIQLNKICKNPWEAFQLQAEWHHLECDSNGVFSTWLLHKDEVSSPLFTCSSLKLLEFEGEISSLHRNFRTVQFFYLKSILRNQETIISLTITCSSISVFHANF